MEPFDPAHRSPSQPHLSAVASSTVSSLGHHMQPACWKSHPKLPMQCAMTGCCGQHTPPASLMGYVQDWCELHAASRIRPAAHAAQKASTECTGVGTCSTGLDPVSLLLHSRLVPVWPADWFWDIYPSHGARWVWHPCPRLWVQRGVTKYNQMFNAIVNLHQISNQAVAAIYWL